MAFPTPRIISEMGIITFAGGPVGGGKVVIASATRKALPAITGTCRYVMIRALVANAGIIFIGPVATVPMSLPAGDSTIPFHQLQAGEWFPWPLPVADPDVWGIGGANGDGVTVIALGSNVT